MEESIYRGWRVRVHKIQGGGYPSGYSVEANPVGDNHPAARIACFRTGRGSKASALQAVRDRIDAEEDKSRQLIDEAAARYYALMRGDRTNGEEDR